MDFLIFHFHFRPGGVRRVIEIATPYLLRYADGKIRRVILATGEAPDAHWLKNFERLCAPVPVEIFLEPAFGYFVQQSGSPLATGQQIDAGLKRLFSVAKNPLVWAHNLGIARNFLLTHSLMANCAEREIPLLAHHHDWWFDNRWHRWEELKECGFNSLTAIAEALFSLKGKVKYATINQSETAVLAAHMKDRVAWLPNPVESKTDSTQPTSDAMETARKWLCKTLDDDSPAWLLPCRLLRRKNIAEAILLTRWLRPEAWLVTTAGASSAEEQVYADRLAEAAKAHGWRVRLGILSANENEKPSVAALMAVSETVMLTSIQEGFGLPYIEAAAAGRPLIARSIPYVVEDLRDLQFQFPQVYDEIFVDTSLFDWEAECERQRTRFDEWKSRMPALCEPFLETPSLMTNAKKPQAIAFSRLTLTAQLEVLAKPIEQSWKLCKPLNSFLESWRKRAQNQVLEPTPWTQTQKDQLSGEAYAERFFDLINKPSQIPADYNPETVLHDFLREKLRLEQIFPLLWKPES